MGGDVGAAASRWGRVGFLGLLYMTQGLPFGFQTKTLAVYLRMQGLSLPGISLISLLSLPWMLKLLWAPLVDVFYVERLGRRRSWVILTLAVMGEAAAERGTEGKRERKAVH